MIYILQRTDNGQKYYRYFINESSALMAMEEERKKILSRGVLKEKYSTKERKEFYRIIESSLGTVVTYTLSIISQPLEDE